MILPVLSVALTLSRRRLQRGDAVEFIATALAVLLGLAIRSRFLPMLGGAYGGYFEVMRNADHLNNVVGYLSAFARTPFDLASPPVRVWTSLQFGSALFLTVFALREKRRALVLLLAFIACILPVLWLAPGLRQTDGSRALYSPSLLVVAVLGLAFERDNERATYPALVVYVLTCIVSLWYQSAVWRSATDLSRSVVAQVSQHLGAPALYLKNLPSTFEQGPYVLKTYAFQFYFEGIQVPAIRAQEIRMRYRRGTVSAGDVIVDSPVALEGEASLHLELQTE